jgi:hypothetical protein
MCRFRFDCASIRIVTDLGARAAKSSMPVCASGAHQLRIRRARSDREPQAWHEPLPVRRTECRLRPSRAAALRSRAYSRASEAIVLRTDP